MPEARCAGECQGPLPSLSARHGRLRRNALSPHGVRLSIAPSAPLRSGYSSANRVLSGTSTGRYRCRTRGLWRRMLRSLSSSKGAGSTAVRVLSGSSPLACGTRHARRNAQALRQSRKSCCSYLSSAHHQRLEQPLYRVDGPSGVTQAAENHGRTISERDHRNPQRRARA